MTCHPSIFQMMNRRNMDYENQIRERDEICSLEEINMRQASRPRPRECSCRRRKRKLPLQPNVRLFFTEVIKKKTRLEVRHPIRMWILMESCQL